MKSQLKQCPVSWNQFFPYLVIAVYPPVYWTEHFVNAGRKLRLCEPYMYTTHLPDPAGSSSSL